MPDEVVRREPSGRDGDLRPLLFKSGCLSYAGGSPSRLKATSLNISPCWYRPLNLSCIRGVVPENPWLLAKLSFFSLDHQPESVSCCRRRASWNGGVHLSHANVSEIFPVDASCGSSLLDYVVSVSACAGSPPAGEHCIAVSSGHLSTDGSLDRGSGRWIACSGRWLARLWGGWQEALAFVQPRTVIAWQRQRFRDHWRRLSQKARLVGPPLPRSSESSFARCGRRIRPGDRRALSGNSGNLALMWPNPRWRSIGHARGSHRPQRGRRSSRLT